MEILVCVKRVPTVGGAITLTADGQAVDTRMSGFTISPHEECAVEEAVRIVERLDGVRGSVTVVTLGPAEAEEQLRSCLALGASKAVLLETSAGQEFGPIATAAALASVAASGPADLVLLGNEASDTGDYQVGIRLAHLLGRPVATGIKALTASPDGGSVEAQREYRGVAETFRLPLPCVVTVKEGINLPRYPSLPGRLRAKRAVISRVPASFFAEGLRFGGLRVPEAKRSSAEVLGHGAAAVPELMRVLGELGVLS
jgi:electron transfer flavoprotein beta subunit